MCSNILLQRGLVALFGVILLLNGPRFLDGLGTQQMRFFGLDSWQLHLEALQVRPTQPQ